LPITSFWFHLQPCAVLSPHLIYSCPDRFEAGSLAHNGERWCSRDYLCVANFLTSQQQPYGNELREWIWTRCKWRWFSLAAYCLERLEKTCRLGDLTVRMDHLKTWRFIDSRVACWEHILQSIECCRFSHVAWHLKSGRAGLFHRAHSMFLHSTDGSASSDFHRSTRHGGPVCKAKLFYL
jgi:hypothetical protein